MIVRLGAAPGSTSDGRQHEERAVLVLLDLDNNVGVPGRGVGVRSQGARRRYDVSSSPSTCLRVMTLPMNRLATQLERGQAQEDGANARFQLIDLLLVLRGSARSCRTGWTGRSDQPPRLEGLLRDV